MCWQWLHSDNFVLFASLTFQDGPSAGARMKQASRVRLLLARALSQTAGQHAPVPPFADPAGQPGEVPLESKR